MTQLDDNFNFEIDIFDHENEDFIEFEQHIKSTQDNVLQLLLRSYLNKSRPKDNIAQNFDWDLKSLIEKNKQLKEEIDSKAQEVDRRQTQYENFKQDRKLLAQEIKDTHEAFLMAKKYYKKFLKIYFTIDKVEDGKQKIYVQFFTETRKTSDDYSVCFLKDIKTGHYELSDMMPKSSTYKDIQKKLLETNDVPAVLCCIRQAFLKMKQNKTTII